jgi:hypothetical protein
MVKDRALVPHKVDALERAVRICRKEDFEDEEAWGDALLEQPEQLGAMLLRHDGEVQDPASLDVLFQIHGFLDERAVPPRVKIPYQPTEATRG